MIQCKDLSEEAGNYLDATLPLRKRIELFIHLLICHNCRNYLQQIRSTIKTVKVLRPKEKVSVDIQAWAQELHALSCKHD